MTLVTRGLMNKQVAGELGLSEITVKLYRGQAMRKMEPARWPIWCAWPRPWTCTPSGADPANVRIGFAGRLAGPSCGDERPDHRRRR